MFSLMSKPILLSIWLGDDRLLEQQVLPQGALGICALENIENKGIVKSLKSIESLK